MRGTCAGCKYWGPLAAAPRDPGDLEYHATTFARCTRVEHATRQYMGSDSLGEAPVKGAGAVTVDGEDYHSALLTEHDFGCNRWEAKDG